MDTKGGRITVEFNGQSYTARGAAQITPSSVEIENGANQNGSGYSTVKPVLPSAELTFDRDLFKWDEALMLASYNVTFFEEDVGVTHIFTGARLSGRPTISTENGEVSGLKVETDRSRYQQYRG